MAIGLSREELWDRPIGGHSPDKHIPHWAGNILYVFFVIVLKIAFRYSVVNREALRAFIGKKYGVVLVANHTSFVDVALMYAVGRPSQWIRQIGRDSLFEKPLFGQILSRVGGFPIKRDTADRLAIKRAARDLKNGEAIGIFPEGTRRGKGSKNPDLHGGAALIAKMGHAPLLPVTFRNVDQVKRKGERVRFPHITVVFGEPIAVGAFDFIDKSIRMDACMWYVMREVFALNQDIPAEKVDMVSLFPESRDFSDLFEGVEIPRVNMDDLPDFVEKGE